MGQILELLTEDTWVWIGLVALLGLALYMVLSHRVSRTLRTITIFLIVLVYLLFFVIRFAAPTHRWGCVLALLPSVLIFQHAVFLRLVRMPFRIKEEKRAAFDRRDPTMFQQNVRLMGIFATARKNTDRYFSPSTLAVRYGTPAVAVAVVGIIVYFLLFTGEGGESKDPNVQAARLGVAGAYVYVLLYLGQRNFRHDVTSGGAMWCAVLLALGPILAWSISHFTHGDFTALAPGAQGAAAATPPAPVDDPVSSEVIYFFAGLAPRHVASFVEEAVRRLWISPSSTTAAPPRTIPITQVRGITSEIAERFAEEGILDLYGLASADPLRLIRNTNYDKRQILSWIDEAILIATLPDHWQLLEKEGITGAIDLVWLKKVDPSVDLATPQYTDPEAELAKLSIDLKSLSVRLKIDAPEILAGVVCRLSMDAQLSLVWVLYHVIDQLDAETEAEPQSQPQPQT